ncbi:urease-like [Pyrus ussuriensis x Pyrus communis]|uniref:Urease-like n=1 Tax=Pyrus ussuriensis x Pyrus communis TaxID=2448454 RepID=A0A5N5I697_9ROSA|nr:urease-like [Pyrus ussuriensis x Pyrus communis]KAB2634663.1 urease-like [Pyrus ussuriensis x Pyrus communis]
MVIKCGAIAWANMGDPNVSIPTPETVISRPMLGAFVKAAVDNWVKDLYCLDKREVDPEKYTVTADGMVLTCSPATTVPLSRNYFMFYAPSQFLKTTSPTCIMYYNSKV